MGKYRISYLNEKWELLANDVLVQSTPRTHELVYLTKLEKYFRVVNVVYRIHKNKQNINVIIEEYLDDYALLEK
tara:strand:+ start:104237 stop:104458 length:222 start_codon:yes stop_codon:yes gene_type:complete